MIKKHIVVVVEAVLFLLMSLILDWGRLSFSSFVVILEFIVFIIIARATEVIVFRKFEDATALPKHRWLKAPVCIAVIGAEIYLCRWLLLIIIYGTESIGFIPYAWLGFFLAFIHLLFSYAVDVFMGVRESVFARLDRALGIGPLDLDEDEGMSPIDEQEDNDSDRKDR